MGFPGLATPNDPTQDPTVQMFQQALNNPAAASAALNSNASAPGPIGQAPQQDPSQLSAITNSMQGAMPVQGPTTQPVTVPNPASTDTPGVLKKMLMNFVYGMGNSMKHAAGLPTDAEVAKQKADEDQRKFNNNMAVQKAQQDAANQKSEMDLRAAQLAKIQAELQGDGGETPTQEFTRRKGEAQSLGLTGDDMVRYILKHDPATDKTTAPSVAKFSIDAANPDPTISGPAKAALTNMAGYWNMTHPKGETGSVDPQPYIDLMKQGQLSMDGMTKLFPGKDYAGLRASIILGANKQGVDLNKSITQSSATQISAIQGALDDVNQSMQRIRDNKLDGDDTPWLVSHPGDIAKYKFGMTPDTDYGQHMASMSLGRVKQAGMVLNKASRAYPALMQAMEHTPSIYYSPKANLMRLNDIKSALENSAKEVRTTGTRSGLPAKTQPADPWGIR